MNDLLSGTRRDLESIKDGLRKLIITCHEVSIDPPVPLWSVVAKRFFSPLHLVVGYIGLVSHIKVMMKLTLAVILVGSLVDIVLGRRYIRLLQVRMDI